MKNITLSLDESLVKTVRKIAVERETTLTGLVRAYLQSLAAESNASAAKQRQMESLRRGFEEYRFDLGARTWTRADLYERGKNA